MRLASDINPAAPLPNPILGEAGTTPQERYADYKIIRRNGAVVGFEPDKISVAMTKAFLAVSGNTAAASAGVRDKVHALTEAVVQALIRRHPAGGTFHIEDIQDQVELALMRAGEHQVARSYVLYREERARERAKRAQEAAEARTPAIHVMVGGAKEPLDSQRLEGLIASACEGLGGEVDAKKILDATLRDLYDGVPIEEVYKCAILAARMLIEQDPDYTYVTARLLLHTIRREVLGEEATQAEMSQRYAEYFPTFISQGVRAQLLDERLASYDLKRLGAALKPDRDLQFNYLGLQTLYDRYFLHINDRRIELPQAFYMRVAMGLALNEIDREARAIEFYDVLSTFDFMSSTPTLFNSGTQRSQLSSCYLTTVADDLDGIYEAIKENALLSKFAGGLGNDWTPVRALGSYIKGTNGKSQGVVPFLKVVSDTAVAVNQGGKRKGAVCCYLETWHLDIEEFLELRKNTGDDRRRTHDMNTANWIPDLFMKRVMEGGEWTLFSPSDVPDLHDKVGKAFEEAYTVYEKKAARGEIKLFKKIPAQSLWRKMLTMLFETGHPWITFKDPSNIRSPQGHVGVVHSSNLCCIAADQRVVTDRGMLTVGELFALGGKNKVVGLDGLYDASEMVLPRPNAPMVRIETAEGYSHKVTPDHKVWVRDRGWVEAQHLKAGDPLLIQQVEGMWGNRSQESFAYALGRAAGGALEAELTTAIIEGNTVLKARPVQRPRVPNLIWQGDRATVCAYLRGIYQVAGAIMDVAGQPSVCFTSNDRSYIEELQLLWANFGVKSAIRADDHEVQLAISSIQGCRIADEVTGLDAYRKSEAAQAYIADLKSRDGYQQRLHATFTHLTRLPNEDAYCLTVDSDTHAWTVNGLVTKNTEITLNTNAHEIAVCNLGSVNLRAHIVNGKLDHGKLKRTIGTAMRMLDNVIDINYYAVRKAHDSNKRHRPVGLGIMGFQDCLHELRIPYASDAAVEFADRSMEAVCYYAYWASTELARERGRYSTFGGSLWDRGILPQDSLKLLLDERGGYVEVDMSESMDWPALRKRIGEHGMRNSNCIAIAPTATISNIIGVSASIEPNYQNLFVKSNLSGEFTVVNDYLVRDLKKLGLWDAVMVNDLKHFDGSIGKIDRIPPQLRELYATAFEVEPKWLVEAGARRQKWIDQAQSLNIYMAGASGKKLDETYKLAWLRGLKTTYYLRTLAATSAEKSTGKGGELNSVAVTGGMGGMMAASGEGGVKGKAATDVDEAKFCSIDNPDCEACQ